MKRIAILLLITAFACVSCQDAPDESPHPRIISYSPAVTDILFDLDLGDNLIGVTSWCILPEGVSKPTVGHEAKMNTEQVLGLDPDVIFIQQSPAQFEPLKKLSPNMQIVRLNHDSIDGIFDSVRKVGQAADASDRAEQLVAKLQARLNVVRTRCEKLSCPRVLFVTGYDHPMTSGSGTFINEIIEIAGGVNAAGHYTRWPSVNAEIILSLKPDVIICLVEEHKVASAREYWQSLPGLQAARNNRVYITSNRRITIYGSRVADTAEQFAEWIHPASQDKEVER